MSRYQPYPKYKDSGVEWLGEVPSGWKKSYLKYISNINMGQSPSSSNYNNEGIGMEFLQGNADFGKFHPTARTFTTEIKKIAQQEDILFTVRAPVGAMNIANQRYAIGRGLCAISSNKDSENAFLWWLMPVLTTELNSVATGSTYEAVTVEQVNNLTVIVPGIIEQTAITNFLDRETAKIDILIEKQQRMIELLKEKRQAVISHAVTKGLDPNVKMKDSGVEWLGDIPEDWIKSKLGYETKVKARLGWKGLKADEYVEDGYIFLATPNIKNNKIDFVNVNYITEERYKESPEIMLENGDVLVTKDGSTTGTTNVVRSLPKPTTVNSSIAVIRPNHKINSIFLYYYFLSTYIQETINLLRGGMGVPHLFQADLRFFNILLPSIQEQQIIADYLDDKTAKIDTLINQANQAITLLKERRTALISAAVTGKIDVREQKS